MYRSRIKSDYQPKDLIDIAEDALCDNDLILASMEITRAEVIRGKYGSYTVQMLLEYNLKDKNEVGFLKKNYPNMFKKRIGFQTIRIDSMDEETRELTGNKYTLDYVMFKIYPQSVAGSAIVFINFTDMIALMNK